MGAGDQVRFVVPWDCAHLSSKPLSQSRIDVRTAGVFDEIFLLRAKQFKTRIRSHGSRAGEGLSSLIEENIPEKGRWIGFLICGFGEK